MITLTDLDLSFSYPGLRDAGLAELRGLPLKRLNLCCSAGEVTDAGLAELREAPLEDIDLSYCERVSDEGVCALISGKPLTKLVLYGCGKVTEGILPTLLGLPLVKLSLTEGQFSETGLALLKDAFPSIDLYVEEGGDDENPDDSEDSD